MEITARVAIVTGAAAGIGRLIATHLAELGATVLVVDVDAAGAERVAAEIDGRGGRARALGVDLLAADGLDVVLALAEALGGPHILVNNAGGWSPTGRTYPAAPAPEWGAVLDLNLRVPMALTQRCLVPMSRLGGGAVVNIASIAGRGAGAYGSPEYGAAKAGLIRFTTSLAGAPTDRGVRVNCIVPDWIGLDRAEAEVNAMTAEQRASTPPLIPPRDVVEAVATFVIDESLSGRVLVLDAGRPARLLPDPDRAPAAAVDEPAATEAELREALRPRLEILDGLVVAVERRTEVFDVIATSPSAEQARAAIAALLGVSDIAATAVLDLQARRFAALETGRIRAERDELRDQLSR